jgi:hypothetical protein
MSLPATCLKGSGRRKPVLIHSKKYQENERELKIHTVNLQKHAGMGKLVF